MAFFMLFAMGRYLHVGGNTFGIPLPTSIMEDIPFLRNIRTPSRAVVYVYLFLAISTAISLKHLLFDKHTYLTERSLSVRHTVVVLLATVIFLDFYPKKLDSTKVECPRAYENVRNDPSTTFGLWICQNRMLTEADT
jgi:hypothetical protein